MNRCFLLGGHDLEMLEIRHLLDEQGVNYADAGLDWSNARLSAYADIITVSPDAEYFGVELQEDYPPPRHYTRIDHHNDYNGRPAAILQVATLLGVIPNRHMQLVAANDAGYIPAMQVFGATQDEIVQLRLADRSAQGITPEDERLAERSVSENLVKSGHTIIVRALTPHFSPICDRLFPYRRLMIYTENEWVFYGEGKARLVAELSSDIAAKRVYHGGGADGYIGAAEGAFDTQQIMDFVNKIKNEI